MAILLSVFLAIVVALIAAVAGYMLNLDEDVESQSTVYQADGTKVKVVSRVKPTGSDIGRAIALGVIVGLVNYFAPRVPGVFVAPIGYVVMVALSVYLMVWWHRRGFEFTEMIPFVLLAILFFFTTKAAAFATVAVLKCGTILTAFLTTLPTCLLVIVIGFMLADHFFFLSELKVERGDA